MTDWIGKILWRVCYARQILRSPVLKWYRWSDYMFAWETSLAGLENIDGIGVMSVPLTVQPKKEVTGRIK